MVMKSIKLVDERGNSNGSNSSKCTGEKREEDRDCTKKVVFDMKNLNLW